MRRGLAWALTLPLVLLGTQAAHALAYDLVYPEAHGVGVEIASFSGPWPEA